MEKSELIRKLEEIEWEDFEVKEARSAIPKNSWDTVSAFSNTSGGWLIFGVEKKGKLYNINGVLDPEKIEQNFTTTLRNGNKFNKIIEVKSKKYDFSGDVVLAFYIPSKSANEKPVYFNSLKNTFIRTGSGDQRATSEEIDSFYRQASFGKKGKELTSLEFGDLDAKTIERFRNFFSSKNPSHRYLELNDKEFLVKLGAMRDNKVTFAGLLVFGSADFLTSELTNYRIDYLEIPGKSYSDTKIRYTYRLDSEKNLFESFFDIYERIMPKIEVPFSVKEGIRDDDPPHLQALREALVNLLMHTDYFSPANPRIRFFNNRIEFFNPGGLPKPLKYILKEDYTQPRNFHVAKMFRFLKLSEGMGSGFHKMIFGWKQHYGREPKIESDFDHYKITFPFNDKIIQKTTHKNTYESDEDGVKDGVKDGVRNGVKLTNNQIEILTLMKIHPNITAEAISKTVGINKRNTEKNISKLKEYGILKRIGSAKGGYWEVVE